MQLERTGHPHNAARGAAHEADGAERGRLRIVQLAQAVVDLALDALQLRLLAHDGGLLLAQRRLVLYWFSMALAILAAVLLVVSLTGVFSNTAQKFGQSLTIQKHNTPSGSARGGV